MMRSIQLVATERNWRLFLLRKADPAFLTFYKSIIQRDKHTCQYCGFRGSETQSDFLEVINADGNYTRHAKSNMVTACLYCAQCTFLEAVGPRGIGGGALIYLPELSQGELNALAHTCFVNMVMGTAAGKEAKHIYRDLRLRSNIVEKVFSEGLSQPALYGRLMIEMKNPEFIRMHRRVAHKALRLLPDYTAFLPWIEQDMVNGLAEAN